MTRGRQLLAISILILLLGCTPSEEGSGTDGVVPVPGGTAGAGADENRVTADREEGATESAAEGGTEAELPEARELFLPVELLTGFPADFRTPSDWRIGELPTPSSLDPQSGFILESARQYAAALLSGDATEESYYDRYTETEVEERLRSSCEALRLGVPERLPQGEWAVPYRCLLGGQPAALGGVFYISADGEATVVDAIAEPLARADSGAASSLETEEPPF